jgi:ornithine cyclodeaminase/alanine dehydrogenase-like protein (mu-crystallin family)
MSDVVVSAVPVADYKVKTEWLKDGCFCLNVAADKNFEKDVRERVSHYLCRYVDRSSLWTIGIHVPPIRW